MEGWREGDNVMVMIGNLWNFTALFELPRSAALCPPPPQCIARQAGGGVAVRGGSESQAKLVRANSFNGSQGRTDGRLTDNGFSPLS